MPSPSTRLLCLLGHPVAHSVSPQIHAAALAEAGIDAVYLAFDVLPSDLDVAIKGLRSLGFLGANVTVPYKQALLDLADRRTLECHAVGAVNTMFWEDGDLVADNTDAAGLGDVLADLSVDSSTSVLIYGAGGAARAAAVALGRLGAGVAVRARREEAAAEVLDLARRLGAMPAENSVPDLVVNATPLGLHGEALPEDLMRLTSGQIALDLVYGAAPTPFLAAARSGGARAVDGLGMLVAQAARSFERWTGRQAPREVMDRAARRSVGRELPNTGG